MSCECRSVDSVQTLLIGAVLLSEAIAAPPIRLGVAGSASRTTQGVTPPVSAECVGAS